MSTQAGEVAYCTSRIEQSKAPASATSSTSARASHERMAEAYQVRLAALTTELPVESARLDSLSSINGVTA